MPSTSGRRGGPDTAGTTTGSTCELAEYESELIIRQVTGIGPVQSDKFTKPKYNCKSADRMWTCREVARVCKG